MHSDPGILSDSQEVSALTRRLITEWQREEPDAAFRQRGRKAEVQRFVAVFGIAAHAHRLVAHALDMLDAGLTVEAVPLIRYAYECAVTAVWLAQVEGSAAALLYEEVRQQRTLTKKMLNSTSVDLRRNAEEYLASADPIHPVPGQERTRNFELLCADLDPSGVDLYMHYRLMSDWSHAGARLTDLYLHLGDDGLPQAMTTSPKAEGDSLWRFYAAVSVLWAGTAVDYIDANKRRRELLRDASRKFGWPRDLHLTPEARSRIAAEDKARRRALWKGRRMRRLPH